MSSTFCNKFSAKSEMKYLRSRTFERNHKKNELQHMLFALTSSMRKLMFAYKKRNELFCQKGKYAGFSFGHKRCLCRDAYYYRVFTNRSFFLFFSLFFILHYLHGYFPACPILYKCKKLRTT